MDAILDWPTPKNSFEVRSFHGLTSFYRKFMQKISGICASIFENLKKDNQPFYWTKVAERSFNLLKRKVTEKPMLKLLDFNSLFQGAALSQEDKIVAYVSEKLNEARHKYSYYDK